MAESVKQEVLAVVRGVLERYSNGDFHGMMDYFTENSVWFPPNSDPAFGRKEGQLVAVGFSSAGGSQAKLASECLNFEMIGEDYADFMVFVDIFNAAGETISHIKQWHLFKKIQGKWMIHRFAYSPRTKPAGAK